MRSTFVVLLLLVPTAVAAQGTGLRLSANRLAAEAAATPANVEVEPAQPTQRTPPPPPRPGAGRRRPSMVGYVGDGSIGSQVRLRFDAGFETTAPDRAEFFYGKCGCYRDLPTDHPAYDPDAPGPGPGIAQELDYQQLWVLGEYAMNGRASLYGELPIRWLSPQAFVPGTGTFPDSSGLSDIRGGLKLALVASDTQFVTVQLQADAPTGDAAKGLGTDLLEILTEIARKRGITGFEARVLVANQSMMAVFYNSGYKVTTRREDDVFLLEYDFKNQEK